MLNNNPKHIQFRAVRPKQLFVSHHGHVVVDSSKALMGEYQLEWKKTPMAIGKTDSNFCRHKQTNESKEVSRKKGHASS